MGEFLLNFPFSENCFSHCSMSIVANIFNGEDKGIKKELVRKMLGCYKIFKFSCRAKIPLCKWLRLWICNATNKVKEIKIEYFPQPFPFCLAEDSDPTQIDLLLKLWFCCCCDPPPNWWLLTLSAIKLIWRKHDSVSTILYFIKRLKRKGYINREIFWEQIDRSLAANFADWSLIRSYRVKVTKLCVAD